MEGHGSSARTRVLSLGAALAVTIIFTADQGSGRPLQVSGVKIFPSSVGGLMVDVTPWGPTEEATSARAAEVLAHPAVRAVVGATRRRLLSFQTFEADVNSASAPNAYRATIYDYSNDRPVIAEGTFSDDIPSVRIGGPQPLPNAAEFDEAVGILKADPLLGDAVAAGRLTPYRPMPPLIENPAGRTLGVGLLPSDPEASERHEIVGVDMIHRVVLRFPRGAPPASHAAEDTCGAPGAQQWTSDRGEAGQALVTVTKQDVVLWRFVVVRPAASSGTNGSGIELRHVEYMGKRVLERAHAPILNVKYEEAPCGPYRDWLWEEGMFDAVGDDAAPGFIECSRAPRTVEETITDNGSFRGVALNLIGDELVLVSELEAGWYRYRSEWRLAADGTIRPRFHFASVDSSCTCALHNHHVYWRFDFALSGQEDNLIAVRDGSDENAAWRVIETEERQLRRDDRLWRVEDALGNAYVLVPGSGDGVADPFGVGDVWVLRHHADEIDDGNAVSTTSEIARANIDKFLTSESVRGQNVVVWYAAHVRHGDGDGPGYDVGPELRPEAW